MQNHAAALAEAARLMRRAAETGAVEDHEEQAPPPVSLTYRAFVKDVFSVQFMPTYRPATQVRYTALHGQGVMDYFGDMPLDAILPAEFRTFAALTQKKGIQVKGPINLARTVLHAAHESGHLDELPDFPRGLIKTSRKLPEAPSFEEFKVMLTAPGWLGVAIALAGLAGLRMGEVRALEVRDLDLQGGRLLVRHALSEDEVVTPKSGHERMVPLVPSLADRLREAMKDKLPRARVVVGDAGETPTRQDVLRFFKSFLRRQGLKEWSFHSLRHYFVSELLKGGAGAEAVRVLAGHSKLEMTQRYAHATTADLRAAIDRLGK